MKSLEAVKAQQYGVSAISIRGRNHFGQGLKKADGVVYSKDARKNEGFLFISDMISSAYSAVLVYTPSPTMGLFGFEYKK